MLTDEKETFIDNVSSYHEKEETGKELNRSKSPKVVIKIKKKTSENPSNTNSISSKNNSTTTTTTTKCNIKHTVGSENCSNSKLKNKIISDNETSSEANEKKESKCLECDKIFSHLTSQKEHFNSLDNDHGPFQCTTCPIWCPNLCSLKAHKRFHTMDSPFVCPECGYQSEKFKKMMTHCIIKCQHLLRQLLYICSKCKITFNTISSLIEHITSSHTQQLIRCATCNQNFDSIDKFERHKVNHPSEDGYRSDNFYQCHICSKELLSKILCYSHIESHLKETKDMYKFVYICPQCKERQCDSGSQVLVHLQAAHLLDLTKPDREASLVESLCDRYKIKLSKVPKEAEKGSNAKKSSATSSSSTTTTTKSSMSTTSSTSLTSNNPLNDSSLKATKFACEVCGLITNSWDDMADHGSSKHIDEESLFVCLICSNKKFTRRNSLLAHLRKFHTTSLACPSQRCISLRFKNATDIYNHYRMKHRLDCGDLKEPISKQSDHQTGNANNNNNNGDPTPAKRPKTNQNNNKQNNHKNSVNNKTNTGSSLASNYNNNTSINNLSSSLLYSEENGSSDILKDSLLNGSSYVNQCIHCGFQSDGIKQLQAHYTIHRTPKSPYLCYECGTSFVTCSLLDRHLNNLHGITDCQSYVKINLPDLYQEKVDPNNIDLIGIIQNDTLNESMCPVCSKICSDSAALKSHVKVHGMAFINSIRKNLNTSTTNDVA